MHAFFYKQKCKYFWDFLQKFFKNPNVFLKKTLQFAPYHKSKKKNIRKNNLSFSITKKGVHFRCIFLQKKMLR